MCFYFFVFFGGPASLFCLGNQTSAAHAFSDLFSTFLSFLVGFSSQASLSDNHSDSGRSGLSPLSDANSLADDGKGHGDGCDGESLGIVSGESRLRESPHLRGPGDGVDSGGCLSAVYERPVACGTHAVDCLSRRGEIGDSVRGLHAGDRRCESVAGGARDVGEGLLCQHIVAIDAELLVDEGASDRMGEESGTCGCGYTSM